LCDSRGPLHFIPPNNGYPIDIVPYKGVCKATNAIPVDSHVNLLYVYVDGVDYTAQPTLTLTDNKGTPIDGEANRETSGLLNSHVFILNSFIFGSKAGQSGRKLLLQAKL
jgi:hypothetical protein